MAFNESLFRLELQNMLRDYRAAVDRVAELERTTQATIDEAVAAHAANLSKVLVVKDAKIDELRGELRALRLLHIETAQSHKDTANELRVVRRELDRTKLATANDLATVHADLEAKERHSLELALELEKAQFEAFKLSQLLSKRPVEIAAPTPPPAAIDLNPDISFDPPDLTTE